MNAVDAVARGGVVLYPTNTLWGIGGDARIDGVIERVRALKGRADHSPFLVLVRDVDTLAGLAEVPPAARVLIDAFWPGELTLLLPAGSAAPPDLVGPRGWIGVRLPTHPVPEGLVEQTGAWLVSTSANPSGAPAPLSLEDVVPAIRAGVDAVAEGPPAPFGVPSSIVAVPATGAPVLVRAGALETSRLERALGVGLDPT